VAVYGAVLCSCLLVVLGAPTTAAVVPSGGSPDGAAGVGPNGADRAGGETVRVAATASDTTMNCDGESARADGLPDGTYTAVLDRVEDDLAVLEVSDDAGETHELVVAVADLPTAGRHPNAVFEIGVTAGELRTATYDESRSEARLETAQDRFDGLAERQEDDGEDENDEAE
jgi:hypothetical protein